MQDLYPDAYLRMDGVSGGSYLTGPEKIVIHTTETVGTPGYDEGRSAPHVTYNPKTRIFVQHTPFTIACRALVNLAGGVQTNRDMAYQLEIVCYSDKSVADEKPYRLWVGDLPDHAYEDIAKFVRWILQESDVQPYVRMPRPTPRYGPDSPARMSFDEWDNFNGLCGHFEVPENFHWDPGAFNFQKLLDYVEKEESMLTPQEEQVVKDLTRSLNKVGSSGWFAEEAVRLIRRERDNPLHPASEVDEDEFRRIIREEIAAAKISPQT